MESDEAECQHLDAVARKRKAVQHVLNANASIIEALHGISSSSSCREHLIPTGAVT